MSISTDCPLSLSLTHRSTHVEYCRMQPSKPPPFQTMTQLSSQQHCVPTMEVTLLYQCNQQHISHPWHLQLPLSMASTRQDTHLPQILSPCSSISQCQLASRPHHRQAAVPTPYHHVRMIDGASVVVPRRGLISSMPLPPAHWIPWGRATGTLAPLAGHGAIGDTY